MKNRVRILFQDYHAIEASGSIPLQEDWDLTRKEKISYLTPKSGQAAANEAFHIFNAPPELLSVEQKMILDAYTGPSLSVGDVVEVYPEKGQARAYLCASIGWQEAVIEQVPKLSKAPRATSMAPSQPAPPPKRGNDVEKSYKPIQEPTIKYHGVTCRFEVNLYKSNKTICLRLIDQNDGTPVATATVNVPEINDVMPKNYVLVKNYSESKGDSPDQYSLVDCLERAGIGQVMGAFEVSEHGAEVFEMEITNQWILDRAQEKLEEIELNEPKKSKVAMSQKKIPPAIDIT